MKFMKYSQEFGLVVGKCNLQNFIKRGSLEKWRSKNSRAKYSIWMFPKIGVFHPKMDGEHNGKPYFLMDDLGGKTHYFRKHPYKPNTIIIRQVSSPRTFTAPLRYCWETISYEYFIGQQLSADLLHFLHPLRKLFFRPKMLLWKKKKNGEKKVCYRDYCI